MSPPSPWSTECDNSEVHTEKVTSKEACLSAIRGRSVPREMLRGSLVQAQMIQAIVCGIRHHEAFATSTDIERVCSGGAYPAVSRARAARLIMSNQIPELNMDAPEAIPYCIWYPDVAFEETYRQLAERYPAMRYHVGRACAVAGYAGLYWNLKLVPEVAIAEEARDSGSNDIFEYIMSQPTRYAIMNDYKRTVNIEHPIFPASSTTTLLYALILTGGLH